MKKFNSYAASLFIGTLLSMGTASAAVGFLVNAKDIDSNLTTYNYEIQTNCFGSCSDTILGVSIPNLYKADNFYVPYFPDAGVLSISSPVGWSAVVEDSNDLFTLGSSAGVIHWTASAGNELALYSSLSGFIYTSSIASSVEAPFRFQYNFDGRSIDGNLPIPGSSLALKAGLPILTAVPAPAAAWLFGSGLLGVIGFARRKKHSYLRNMAG